MNVSSIKPVVIMGAGGHAKVVAEALKKSGREIIGLTEPEKKEGEFCFGINVLGNDDVIKKFMVDEIELANGLGALPGDNRRWEASIRMREAGYSFATIVHPMATVAESVSLNEGVQIMAGCVLQPGVSIGQDSIINTGTVLDHDCKVGKKCHIAPGATLCGGVRVGDGTHVGTGVVILQYTSVGENAVVAAGSIVHRDILNDITFIQPRKAIQK